MTHTHAKPNVPWRDLVGMARWEKARELMLSLPWLVVSLACYQAGWVPLGILATFCMVLPGPESWRLATLIFLLGNLGFAGANIFYDALLPHLVPRKDLDRVSASGFGIGYLGGGLLLAVHLLWLRGAEFRKLVASGVVSQGVVESVEHTAAERSAINHKLSTCGRAAQESGSSFGNLVGSMRL